MFTHGRTHKQVPSTRVVSCPKFTAGYKVERDKLLMETKKKYTVCQKCSGFTHKTSDCRLNYTCKICNGEHLTVLHDHHKVLSCSVRGRVGAASMSMQDIEIKHGP